MDDGLQADHHEQRGQNDAQEPHRRAGRGDGSVGSFVLRDLASLVGQRPQEDGDARHRPKEDELLEQCVDAPVVEGHGGHHIGHLPLDRRGAVEQLGVQRDGSPECGSPPRAIPKATRKPAAPSENSTRRARGVTGPARDQVACGPWPGPGARSAGRRPRRRLSGTGRRRRLHGEVGERQCQPEEAGHEGLAKRIARQDVAVPDAATQTRATARRTSLTGAVLPGGDGRLRPGHGRAGPRVARRPLRARRWSGRRRG